MSGSNVYLTESFAPVQVEQTLTDLPVTGRIPDYLDGRYLRNGPNPIGEIDPATYHWFSGDGMVHGVRLREGRAEWYRNRWVRTPRVAKRLGEPFRGPRRHAGHQSISANTSVIGHAGRTIALIEGGLASIELDDELETVGACDFDGTLHGGYVAHPKRDPDTGELHAVSYSPARGDRVRYSVIDAQGRARRTLDLEVTGSPMMHDFSLTEKYVVVYDLPVTFDARQGVRMIRTPRPLRPAAELVLAAAIGRVRVPGPLASALFRAAPSNSLMPYRWDPSYPARVGVLPREGSADDIRWFDVAPCYVFHPLNAFDDGDTVVLDVVRHERMFETDFTGPDEGGATLDRWTLDLASGKVREERLDDRPQEFPRIDERLTGKRHRYGYAMQTVTGGHATDTVLKHDLIGATTSRRSFGPGKQVGEFVFVPGGAGEDDGTLMGFVFDPATARSELVLLDGSTLEIAATVSLPVRVPQGFHGNWVPSV